MFCFKFNVKVLNAKFEDVEYNISAVLETAETLN